MLVRLLALLVAVIQQPEFATELWPGEGRPVFAIAAAKVQLLSEPLARAKVVDSLTLPVGTRIQFDETRFATVRSGLIRFDSAGAVSGRVLGSIAYLSRQDYYNSKFRYDTLPMPSGAEVAYLQYRAEGTCFVRVKSDVIDAHPCPGGRRSGARVIKEPELEWWVRVVVEGQPRGWVRVGDSTLRQVDRQF